jgi:hypothetical protein
MKEPCSGCGCVDWLEARFSMGRLWCITCWQGSQRPAISKPPTPAEQRSIADWLAPLKQGARL